MRAQRKQIDFVEVIQLIKLVEQNGLEVSEANIIFSGNYEDLSPEEHEKLAMTCRVLWDQASHDMRLRKESLLWVLKTDDETLGSLHDFGIETVGDLLSHTNEEIQGCGCPVSADDLNKVRQQVAEGLSKTARTILMRDGKPSPETVEGGAYSPEGLYEHLG